MICLFRLWLCRWYIRGCSICCRWSICKWSICRWSIRRVKHFRHSIFPLRAVQFPFLSRFRILYATYCSETWGSSGYSYSYLYQKKNPYFSIRDVVCTPRHMRTPSKVRDTHAQIMDAHINHGHHTHMIHATQIMNTRTYRETHTDHEYTHKSWTHAHIIKRIHTSWIHAQIMKHAQIMEHMTTHTNHKHTHKSWKHAQIINKHKSWTHKNHETRTQIMNTHANHEHTHTSWTHTQITNTHPNHGRTHPNHEHTHTHESRTDTHASISTHARTHS